MRANASELLHCDYFSKFSLSVVFSQSIFVPVVGAIYLVLCSLHTCYFFCLSLVFWSIHDSLFFIIVVVDITSKFHMNVFFLDLLITITMGPHLFFPFFFFSRVSSTESYCFSQLTDLSALRVCSNR